MDEDARRDLYARLKEVMGDPHAATLMRYLPPTEPTALATKSDLNALSDALRQRFAAVEERFAGVDVRLARVEARLDGLEARLDALEARLDGVERHMDRFDDRLHDFHGALREQTRTFVAASVGSMITLAIVAFGAAALI